MACDCSPSSCVQEDRGENSRCVDLGQRRPRTEPDAAIAARCEPTVPLHTHYENLKIARNAPPEVIRAAYRVLAQRFHPDVNPSPDAARVMTLLNEAYAVLSDPQQRAVHDSWIEDHLIKEALDEALAQTWQAAPDARRAPQHQEASSPAPAPSPAPVVAKGLSNILGPLGVVGLLLVVGFQMTAGKRAVSSPPVVTYQQPDTAWVGERAWPEVERTTNFASLSPAEKDSVREAYFERVVAPKVSPGQLAAARAQFYLESGHSNLAAVQAPRQPPTRRPPSAADMQVFDRQTAGPAWSPNGKPWPARAAYLDGFRRRAASGLSTLTIDNTAGGADVYVKLCRASADRCDGLRHVFIPLGASFTMSKIAAGTYDIRYRSLDNGALAKSEPMELEQVEEARGIRYSTVRLTLYRVAGGNTTFESLPEDKF